MSWPLTGLVSKKTVGSAVRRLVLLTMASRANDDGSGVYFSFETIARACELSRATVKRTIKDFEREKIIKQVGTRECPGGQTNDYTLSVAHIEALPDLPKDPGQREPGSQRPGVKDTNPGQPEPGLQRDPGSERPPSNTSSSSNTASSLRGRAVFDLKLWDARMAEAVEAAGPSLRHTNPASKMLTTFRNLCEPAAGEPCDWDRDVIPAIQMARARGAKFDKWDYIRPAAIENRDKRLAGLPTPEPVSERPRAAAPAGRRPSMASVVNRMVAEGKLT